MDTYDKNDPFGLHKDRRIIKTEVEKVVEISLERLHSFHDHPFKVKDDEEMQKLKESIEKYGIMNPLIVMPMPDGVYQIVSGHRRKYCAEQLGYTKVPVIIRYFEEEDSIISMVDSNLHREKLLFSEKAMAYKMKNEAMKRKTGKRRKTQKGTVDSLMGKKTISLIGEETGESARQVHRYICLTRLIPELLKMLDEKELSFNPAVEISSLTEEEQHWVVDAMDYTQSIPSVSQSRRFKVLSSEGTLTKEKIIEILTEIKKGDMNRVTFKNSQMYKYFPREYSTEQIKTEILKLLEAKYNKKEKRGRRKKENE